ncbi:MAG: SMP-30/gluconolactonase/LRE family protein [Planctomycetia bacterium]|nr:SMP-30/gluconolactonase/LRE family protein [Planctomycetia bacterium]
MRTARPLFAALLFLLAPAAFAADLAPPTGKGIVPEGAKLELLFTRTVSINGGLTEGPAVAPDGSIYFTDIPSGRDKGLIMRFDPKTKKTTVFSDDSGKANGLAFDREGRLVACEGADQGGRCVSWWDTKTGKRIKKVDNIGGKKFNAPNDLCFDRAGNLYFTDPRYLGDEPRELEHRAVYRINTGGQVEEITHEVSKPNGIALSPDDKTLYVADHDNGTDKIDPNNPPAKKGPMTIYAFPLGPDGKVAGKRVTLVDFGTEDGCDGMCVDRKGNIYLTARGLKRPGVLVINAKGQEVAFIPTGAADQKEGAPPVGLPSNVEFGIGAESKVLYVTVDKSLYRIPLLVEGLHAHSAAK